jgi:hypothetical protein
MVRGQEMKGSHLKAIFGTFSLSFKRGSRLHRALSFGENKHFYYFGEK